MGKRDFALQQARLIATNACAFFILGIVCLAQQPATLPVHSVIDLAPAGCQKVLDFRVVRDSIHAVCLTEHKAKVLIVTDSRGRLLRSPTGIPLRRNTACGLAVSPSGNVLIWSRAGTESYWIPARASAGSTQSLAEKAYDIRFHDDENLVAADGAHVFRGQVDFTGSIRWQAIAAIESQFPLAAFPIGSDGVGLLDFSRGTVSTASPGAEGVGPVRAALEEAAHLPSSRGDGTWVPTFYTADVDERGRIFALVPGFKHHQGALLVSLLKSGELSGKWRLAMPTHPNAVTPTHPAGHEVPMELRSSGGSAYTLSLRGPRIARYILIKQP